jgi:hypothetical protein
MSYKFKPVKRLEVENKLEKSLKKLLKNDFFLLESNAHERSITHKLAEYLQDEFEEWNVDCEYNRKGHRLVKKLHNWEKDYKEELEKDKLNEKNVFPDIIVHKRGKRQNLLVIEVKKSTNDDNGDSDKVKLNAFIDELRYKYGVFISFDTGRNPGIKELEWFPKNKFMMGQKNESGV